MGFLSLLAIPFLDAFAAELAVSIQKAVEVKFEFVRDPLVEMKIRLIPVRFSWHPTNSLCNLEHLYLPN